MSRATLYVLVLSSGLAACAGKPDVTSKDQVRLFKIRITESPTLTVPINEAAADQILAKASKALATPEDPKSAPCPVILVRDGPIIRLPVTMPTIVQTKGDFDKLSVQLPGEGRAVRVVEGITWCGTQGDGILGCSNIPGNILVVRRYMFAEEPYLWDHEFGHNRGLDHVEQETRLMYPYLSDMSREIMVDECSAFNGPTPTQLPVPRLPKAATIADFPDSDDIDKFVAGHYNHGFPTVAASKFSRADVQKILPLLKDPSQKDKWPNIILTAGAAGGSGVSTQLIDFIMDRNNVPTDPSVQFALSSVPISLGYLANQAHDDVALKFLLQKSQPGSWLTVAERVPSVEGQIGFERELSVATLNGLSVSGRKEAIARLTELQDKLRSKNELPLPGLPGAATQEPEASARQSEIIMQGIDQANRAKFGLGQIR